MTNWNRVEEHSPDPNEAGRFFLVYLPDRDWEPKRIQIARYSWDQYGYGGDSPSGWFSLEIGQGECNPTHWAELPEATR